jgi:ATP-binding cassette subfamily B protein
MTDHYEDTDEGRERVLKNRQVVGFISRYWLRRPWLLTGTVGLTLVAIGFDLSMPWASGRLVDAVAAGPSHPHEAWRAWAVFVGVYLAFSVIRNTAMRFLIPMSANNMKDMTDVIAPHGAPSPAPRCAASAAPCGAMTWSPTRP